MDVTHVGACHYLTIVDNGPSRFAVWRHLRRQDSASIIEELEQLFCERGPPEEILTDNATAFRSRAFREFAEKWGIAMRFRSAHQPSGNGIAERCHRTVKRAVARSGCTVQEALYWYNLTPKDDMNAESAPANELYRYEVRLRGIDVNVREPGVVRCRFGVGDRVWVRDPSRKCDAPSSIGTVTDVVSAQTVEVDGMPRHVRDLRAVTARDTREPEPAGGQGGTAADDDEPWLIRIPASGTAGEEREEENGPDDGAPESEQEHPEPEQSTYECNDAENHNLEMDPEPLGRGRRVTWHEFGVTYAPESFTVNDRRSGGNVGGYI